MLLGVGISTINGSAQDAVPIDLCPRCIHTTVILSYLLLLDRNPIHMGRSFIRVRSKTYRRGSNPNSFQGVLRELGCESFAEFLQSALWNHTKQRVLRTKPVCECCDQPATCVHIARYDKPTMTGKQTQALHSLCLSCLGKIKYTGGSKRTLAAQNKQLKSLLK